MLRTKNTTIFQGSMPLRTSLAKSDCWVRLCKGFAERIGIQSSGKTKVNEKWRKSVWFVRAFSDLLWIPDLFELRLEWFRPVKQPEIIGSKTAITSTRWMYLVRWVLIDTVTNYDITQWMERAFLYNKDHYWYICQVLSHSTLTYAIFNHIGDKFVTRA